MTLIDPIRAREDRAAQAARRAIRGDLERLAKRIESEGDVASRYGQLERLYAIARDLRDIAQRGVS